VLTQHLFIVQSGCRPSRPKSSAAHGHAFLTLTTTASRLGACAIRGRLSLVVRGRLGPAGASRDARILSLAGEHALAAFRTVADAPSQSPPSRPISAVTKDDVLVISTTDMPIPDPECGWGPMGKWDRLPGVPIHSLTLGRGAFKAGLRHRAGSIRRPPHPKVAQPFPMKEENSRSTGERLPPAGAEFFRPRGPGRTVQHLRSRQPEPDPRPCLTGRT